MAPESAPAPFPWSLVVPVKVLGRAKSRLAALGPHRPALALAMATDTVTAALGCADVAQVLVVTDDEAAADALAGLGAHITGDEPHRGLNPALRHGAAMVSARWPGTGVAALAADLPALRTLELGRALREAARWPQAFVPDAAGSGTTCYTARPGTAFSPRFGVASAQRHRRGGAAELTLPGLAGLRRDVDAPGDLTEATGLGVGPHTAAVLAQLG